MGCIVRSDGHGRMVDGFYIYDSLLLYTCSRAALSPCGKIMYVNNINKLVETP